MNQRLIHPMTAVSQTAPQNTAIADTRGFLSEAEAKAIFERCVALASGRYVKIELRSRADGGVRWARNRAFLSETRQLVSLSLRLSDRNRNGSAETSRIDDVGLQQVISAAERALQYNISDRRYDDRPDAPVPVYPISRPTLWSDATAAFDGAKRDGLTRQYIDAAEAAGMLSAGDLRVSAGSDAVWDTDGMARYYTTTRANVSMTVRDKHGTGSGWAGTDDYDIARIDLSALGQRALEKGVASRNPVRLEPGRYTTILEPQAVADLWKWMLIDVMNRSESEDPNNEPFFPFNKGGGRSKIHEQVLDRRLTISSDPMDPQGGFLPFDMNGSPYQPVKWFEQGVPRELAYPWFWELGTLGREGPGLELPWSFRMSGGTASVEDMIATTTRGVLVTRFHDVRVIDQKSMTCTGYTRDGVWLIERGKITKPIKNFRFTESPLLILNRVQQLGVPQRVFSSRINENSVNDGENARIVPPLKVLDFNFTQLADAV